MTNSLHDFDIDYEIDFQHEFLPNMTDLQPDANPTALPTLYVHAGAADHWHQVQNIAGGNLELLATLRQNLKDNAWYSLLNHHSQVTARATHLDPTVQIRYSNLLGAMAWVTASSNSQHPIELHELVDPMVDWNNHISMIDLFLVLSVPVRKVGPYGWGVLFQRICEMITNLSLGHESPPSIYRDLILHNHWLIACGRMLGEYLHVPDAIWNITIEGARLLTATERSFARVTWWTYQAEMEDRMESTTTWTQYYQMIRSMSAVLELRPGLICYNPGCDEELGTPLCPLPLAASCGCPLRTYCSYECRRADREPHMQQFHPPVIDVDALDG